MIRKCAALRGFFSKFMPGLDWQMNFLLSRFSFLSISSIFCPVFAFWLFPHALTVVLVLTYFCLDVMCSSLQPIVPEVEHKEAFAAPPRSHLAHLATHPTRKGKVTLLTILLPVLFRLVTGPFLLLANAAGPKTGTVTPQGPLTFIQGACCSDITP